jgi:hypothetical protein
VAAGRPNPSKIRAPRLKNYLREMFSAPAGAVSRTGATQLVILHTIANRIPAT